MAKKKSNSMTINDLSFIVSEWVLKNTPFVIFLGFLATIYIANAHYAERNVRQIQLHQQQIKEMRWFYKSLHAENMYNSKRSEVVEEAKEEGLQPLRSKPKRLEFREETD